MASSSTAASLTSNSYHVFINHRGPDVKKTLASHLYHRLSSAHNGLRVFFDKQELRAGEEFPAQIKDAIRTASVHVAIFSPRYAESEWCLNELLYMLDSGSPIIPVFYRIQPADLRWKQGEDGVYSKGLKNLEPRHGTITIGKWIEALSLVSRISGLNLHETCNGDEGELVEKIVQRVLQMVKSFSPAGKSPDFYCSQLYGRHGGSDKSDGTYSGIRRITMTEMDHDMLTSIQLHYGLEGDESLKDKYIQGCLHGYAVGSRKEYNLKYPEEFVTQMSGYFEEHSPSSKIGVVIKSLTFHTNKGKYGPCGLQKGEYFETVEGKMVGLFAESGLFVKSIGVYMLKPVTISIFNSLLSRFVDARMQHNH